MLLPLFTSVWYCATSSVYMSLITMVLIIHRTQAGLLFSTKVPRVLNRTTLKTRANVVEKGYMKAQPMQVSFEKVFENVYVVCVCVCWVGGG